MNKSSKEIMLELNEKFNDNFKNWSALETQNLDKAFIYLQCVSVIGEILANKTNSKHHSICCSIYDEIFSDGVSALYLATNAMNKTANIVLRRVLELGVASVYLWDLPHIARSWNDYDYDLSFTEMLKHVNSKGYLAYISSENNTPIEPYMFPASDLQKIYGELSDIVHGKISTFESSLPDRFSFVEKEWKAFIELLLKVLDHIVKGCLIRFSISDELFVKVPSAKKELVN